MDISILHRIKIAITIFVFSAALLGVAGEARAALNVRPAQGPLTGTATGYPYPDLQFYSPIPPAVYSATYNYGCEQSSSEVLKCHKMFPSENINDKYDCGNSKTSPANLAELPGAWLFNNCGFTGDIIPPFPVKVKATPVSTSQITVSWTTSSDNIEVAYYKIFRFKGVCCTPAPILPDITISAPTTTYQHTGLLAGTSYGYYVLAYDAAGNFSSSAGKEYAVTFSDGIPPTNPTTLAALAASTSQINLTWTASTDTGGSGVMGYRIERCTGTGCANFTEITTSPVASYSDTGLAPSTSYSYRVRAYDGAGNNSGYSNIDSDTTYAPPDLTPPTPAPVLSGSAISSTQIQLTWTASIDPESGIANYRVYRDSILIATLGSAALTYVDSGLSPETAYTYRVDAVNGGGLITPSNTVSITTPAIPDTEPPVFIFNSPGSTLLAGTTSATLGGTTDESATCRYSTTNGLVFASMTPFGTTGVTNHTQPITGLTDGTVYNYYVKCRDGEGNTNAVDFPYMFQVDSPLPDTTPPIISNGLPSGTLASGTITAIMSVVTDDDAYCRYNQDSDTTFDLMTNNFTSSDLKNHTVPLTNLTYGIPYLYYVRCQNTPGGYANTSGYPISFIIAFPINMNPVALIAVTPTPPGIAPFALSADGSGSYDSDGSITQYSWNWGDGSPSATGVGSSHTYTAAGTYTLSLKVVDNQGGSNTAYETIEVSAVIAPPPPVNVCTADCTHNSDCTAPNICGPSKFCIAQGSGVGPTRYDGYLWRTDGSMSQPTPATFPAGTASVIMSVKTDVNAECQYSTVSNTPYGASVMKTFTHTGTTAHSVTLTGLQSTTATPHTYYVRCRDLESGIVNNTDQAISFVTGAPIIVPPGEMPYTCLINADYVRNAIPYVFDICIPKP